MLTAHLNQKLTELIPQGAPFAIAFSGGGDSTALVYALRNHPQAKHIYIVDHNLRAGSKAEALAAKAFAVRCGYDAKILTWRHNSPHSALQEKARQARYGFMGHECRMDGIEYLLTAHSEDDQAETVMMRYDRNTDWRGAAGMAEVTYAPIWPQMALVSIVRPLLTESRQALRDYNRQHKLYWAEDPSNQNRDYTRIRARDYLAGQLETRSELLSMAAEMRENMRTEKTMLREQFASLGKIDAHGIITLKGIPLPELLYQCLRCASGQGGLIDRGQIRQLLIRMRTHHFKSATLGGALVAKGKNGFVICRDPVCVKGRQDSHHERIKIGRRLNFRLSDMVQIWDGRFSVTGSQHGHYMGAVYHNSELLNEKQRKELKRIPAAARPTLPVSKYENAITAIGHYDRGSGTLKSLIRARLEAALGGKIS